MKYANVLEDLRKSWGLSQAELAEKAGISQQAISSYENGERLPSVKNADRIAEALDVTLTHMMNKVTEW